MTQIAEDYDVIIAGAGPAGTSAAIHLASSDRRVLLVEQKCFPRPKLCGEFISPECELHFEKLGVADSMRLANPARITETVFYSRGGRHISVPSNWFGGAALGLSRSTMDHNLLRRAEQVGVTVLQGSTVTDLLTEQNAIAGVGTKTEGRFHEYRAPIVIDATGRARTISRKIKQFNHATKVSKSKLIAFKIHLTETDLAPGTCEIYAYPRGYGGLSSVESGISNLCFIASAEDVRRCNSDPDRVMREVVMMNRRAAKTLEQAQQNSEWLSASWERFGHQQPSPTPGLLAIGDSAAFIDPFTGSGMLMALESGQLVSNTIVHCADKCINATTMESLSKAYDDEFKRTFNSRLKTSSLLRRAAFNPTLAEIVIATFSLSRGLRNVIARATRSNVTGPGRSVHSIR